MPLNAPKARANLNEKIKKSARIYNIRETSYVKNIDPPLRGHGGVKGY